MAFPRGRRKDGRAAVPSRQSMLAHTKSRTARKLDTRQSRTTLRALLPGIPDQGLDCATSLRAVRLSVNEHRTTPRHCRNDSFSAHLVLLLVCTLDGRDVALVGATRVGQFARDVDVYFVGCIGTRRGADTLVACFEFSTEKQIA